MGAINVGLGAVNDEMGAINVGLGAVNDEMGAINVGLGALDAISTHLASTRRRHGGTPRCTSSSDWQLTLHNPTACG